MEPSVGWSLIVIIGFFGWIGSTIGFIFRGITKDNRLNTKVALRWGIFIVLFYVLWVIGLYFA